MTTTYWRTRTAIPVSRMLNVFDDGAGGQRTRWAPSSPTRPRWPWRA
jgi:hypothetical protein